MLVGASLLCDEPAKQLDPPRRLTAESGPYGLHDFAERIVGNILVGLEHHMPAVRGIGQLWIWFDPIPDLAENADILKHDFKIDMKIAGQLICTKDIESGGIGSPSG